MTTPTDIGRKQRSDPLPLLIREHPKPRTRRPHLTRLPRASRAYGRHALEAGVELLIRAGRVHASASWIVEQSDDFASVDVDDLLERSGPWSGGQQRIVRIAASLLEGPPVNLYDDVAGIDREYLLLVLAAIAHANGSHEHSGLVYDEDGTPTGFTRLRSAFPWPE